MQSASRSIIVSDRMAAASICDEPAKSRERCRREVFTAIADKIPPGRYTLEVIEESRPRPDVRGTEVRCTVEFLRLDDEAQADGRCTAKERNALTDTLKEIEQLARKLKATTASGEIVDLANCVGGLSVAVQLILEQQQP